MFYAETAETAVIGAILRENYLINEMSAVLQVEDFSSMSEEIIETILSLHTQGIKVDKISLMDMVDNITEEMLDDYIKMGNPKAFQSHLELIENAKIKRMMYDSCAEIQETIDTENLGRVELADLAQAKFTAIANSVTRDTGTISNMKDGVKDAIKNIMNNAKKADGITGLATGFHDFDRITSGLQPSDLIIVAGRPAMGKTSISYNMVENFAANGARGMFFSLEMPKDQIMRRSLSSLGRVEQSRLKTGNLTSLDISKLENASKIMSEMDIVIDEQGGLSYQELTLRARKAHAEKPLQFILVDYLQLIKAPEVKTDNENTRVTIVSASLKALAKELNVPVIALSQLSRDLEKRADKRPINSDLRSSGSIEQDADMICFIYRDEVYHEDSPDKGVAEFIIGKHRNGELGTVRLASKLQFARFENITYEDSFVDTPEFEVPEGAETVTGDQISEIL